MKFLNYIFISSFIFIIILLSCGNASKTENTNLEQSNETQTLEEVKSKIFSLIKNSGPYNIIAPDFNAPEITEQEQNSKGNIVKGKVKNKSNSMIAIQELTQKAFIFLDSTKSDAEGNFIFKNLKVSEPTICFISFGNLSAPGIPVIVSPNSKISLAINYDGWISYEIIGDENNKNMAELYKTYSSHDKGLQDFNRELTNIDPNIVTDSLRQAVQARFTIMSNNRYNDILKFVKTKKASPATYYASTFLFQPPANDIVDAAYKKMNAELPKSKYTLLINTQYKALFSTPEINLPGPDGKMLSLASLKGKVVLIDFWASWCRPCLADVPHVKKLYDQYKSKGFEILGVSLDQDAERWKDAISKYQLNWKHVSELKGWNGNVSNAYNVTGIPYTVLLDKEGKVIAKGLRGEELEAKLAEIFK